MFNLLARRRADFDAILLDLDGTLLDGRSRIGARTHRAVRRLVEAGFEVVLATGRSVAGCTSFWRALDLEAPVAAFNGCWIGRPGRRPWRMTPIPEALVGEAFRAEAESRFSFRHADERKFAIRRAHVHYPRVARWYENVVEVDREDLLPRDRLMRLSCCFDGAADTERAWSALSDDARAGLQLQHYPLAIFPELGDLEMHLAEIQPRTRGKAEVLLWLLAERRIPAERTIAVGDQRNDLSMLEAAGLAVAVGNAVGEVLRLADVVIGPHDEEGFARWVEAGMPGAVRAAAHTA